MEFWKKHVMLCAKLAIKFTYLVWKKKLSGFKFVTRETKQTNKQTTNKNNKTTTKTRQNKTNKTKQKHALRLKYVWLTDVILINNSKTVWPILLHKTILLYDFSSECL